MSLILEGLNATGFDVDNEAPGTIGPRERRRLRRRIQRLPEPCGWMEVGELFALGLVDTCRQALRHAPDSIAVLGIDDDPLQCQLVTPPLPSVISASDGTDDKVADQLDSIMLGRRIMPTTSQKVCPPANNSSWRLKLVQSSCRVCETLMFTSSDKLSCDFKEGAATSNS